jgi:hypothetical protein
MENLNGEIRLKKVKYERVPIESIHKEKKSKFISNYNIIYKTSNEKNFRFYSSNQII